MPTPATAQDQDTYSPAEPLYEGKSTTEEHLNDTRTQEKIPQ